MPTVNEIRIKLNILRDPILLCGFCNNFENHKINMFTGACCVSCNCSKHIKYSNFKPKPIKKFLHNFDNFIKGINCDKRFKEEYIRGFKVYSNFLKESKR